MQFNTSVKERAMDINRKEFLLRTINNIQKIQYVKPEDIPNIDLYMDQVTTFMDKHLEAFKRYEEDKLLTKTMINNYTKNDLLPSPEKKKYSKDHMFFLIFIYYMKNVMSITDIQSLLKPVCDKFFGTKSDISLEDIYEEMFGLGQEQADRVIKDIIHKFNKSTNAFPDSMDDGDAELLRMFTFICLLCFDIHMKKQLIGKLIDDYFVPMYDSEANDKDKGK